LDNLTYVDNLRQIRGFHIGADMSFLMADEQVGVFLGRVWVPDANGPSVVTLRDGHLFDITCPAAPTVRDICEMVDPVAYGNAAKGTDLGPLDTIAAADTDNLSTTHMPAPCDLQSAKARGADARHPKG